MHKYKFSILLLSVLAPAIACTAAATENTTSKFRPGAMAAGAPAELAQWGQLVGQWTTSEESLQQDGSGWAPATGADWDFMWAYDGWGIEDYYISPPRSVALDDESKRQRGINLRIYDPTEKKWILTWLAIRSTKPSSFTATSDGSKIVMLSDEPDPRGNHHRITFYDMTPTSFEWKLEWSKDNENWLEVHRIHGKRKPPAGG